MGKANLMKQFAHFVPSEKKEHNCNNGTYSEIIISSIYQLSNSATTEELFSYIKHNIGIVIHIDNIRSTLDCLIKENRVELVLDKYKLKISEKIQIESLISSENEIEIKTFEFWNRYLTAKYSELGPSEIKDLNDDLKYFIKSIFITHGMESISLISNQFDNFEVDIKISEFLHKLPKRSELIDKIRNVELQYFLSMSESKEYLIIMLDKSLKFLTAICSEDFIESLKTKLVGKKIYLDTSVIFRLLDLQGASRKKIIDDVVELCSLFDIKLYVHRNTMNEFLRRIDWDSKRLLDKSINPSFINIGLKYSDQEDFLTAYWRQSNGGALSVRDFIDKYKQSEIILSNSGICIDDSSFPKESDIIIDSQNYQYHFREFYQKKNRNKFRGDKSIEHDCFMLSFINHEREYKSSLLIDCNMWFLTTDHYLLQFQKMIHDFKNMPFIAILPSHMIQLLRFVRVENGKYDETFINIFSSNSIFSNKKLSPDLIAEILSRISLYTDSPEVAEKALLDATMDRRLNSILSSDLDNAELNDFIEEVIENVYAKIEEDNKLLLDQKDKYINQLVESHDINVKKDSIIKERDETILSLSVKLSEKENNSNEIVSKYTNKLEELVKDEKRLFQSKIDKVEGVLSIVMWIIALFALCMLMLLSYLYQKIAIKNAHFNLFEPYTVYPILGSFALGILNFIKPGIKLNPLYLIQKLIRELLLFIFRYDKIKHEVLKAEIKALNISIEEIKKAVL